jgi:hypothetical protein
MELKNSKKNKTVKQKKRNLKFRMYHSVANLDQKVDEKLREWKWINETQKFGRKSSETKKI